MTERRAERLEVQIDSMHAVEVAHGLTKGLPYKAPQAFRPIRLAPPIVARQGIGPVLGYRWSESNWPPKIDLPYTLQPPYDVGINNLWNYMAHRSRTTQQGPTAGATLPIVQSYIGNHASYVELYEFQSVTLDGRKMIQTDASPLYLLAILRLEDCQDSTMTFGADSSFVFSEADGILTAEHLIDPTQDERDLDSIPTYLDYDMATSGSTTEAWQQLNYYIKQLEAAA